MRRSRRRVEEGLWVLGMHRFGRLMNTALHPQKREHLRNMREFYAALLPPEGLVFDVGAHVGMLSALFASLGHQVIAIEPNRDCIRHIEISYHDLPITVLNAVMGPKAGLVTLNVSDDRDDISSVRNDWIPNTISSRKMQVAMLTLNDLVSEYGMPAFIKIDVEGFEESVLDGLSVFPKLLSFEFNTGDLASTFRCLAKDQFGGALFNYAIQDPQRFELPSWVEADVLKQSLTELSGTGTGFHSPHRIYGDIFAKIG
ncbi:MAG: FkbM family methyltransferase [Nitrospira sp.]|nr:MAG: FkbM family methyltransferase [Nitrospira sp.]